MFLPLLYTLPAGIFAGANRPREIQMFYHWRRHLTRNIRFTAGLASMNTEKTRTVPCPICKEPAEWSPTNEYRPFCSRRCKLIDLGQWATEKYRITGQDTPNQAQLDDEQH
jgi:endogenous inhibitor of DNA gyrase (YacG/DUF329 family)